MTIAENLQRIKTTLNNAVLVAVTKYATNEQMKALAAAGQEIFGESKVQIAKEKAELFKDQQIEWHMIGHLQSNKAKLAVGLFELIQSVDSIKLAKEIDKEAAKINKKQKILVQVNIGSEEQKFGFTPKGTAEAINEISKLSNIEICGLMAMAPYFEDPEESRPYFKKMKNLFDNSFKNGGAEGSSQIILSMGMSHDYLVAIEEGANMVRIGSALIE